MLSSGNWDFEPPDIPGSSNAWVTYPVGGTIGSWTVIGSESVNVAHINENTIWPGNSSQFLDLTGVTGNGGIAWSNIATVVGQQYEASWIAFNGSLVFSTDGTPANQLFTFQATGGTLTAYDLVPGTSAIFTYTFTATDSLTTIMFKENTGFDSNAGWIDNVVLEAVPEPGVLNLMGLAAVLAGFLISRRRAQGDALKAVAHAARMQCGACRP